MAKQSFPTDLPEPKSRKLEKTHTILEYARDTATSLLDLFNEHTKSRGPGAPTDEEQDLLRAMLMFAGAALDAALKQIVKDALEAIIDRSEEAEKKFQEFVRERISPEAGSIKGKELSMILTAKNPRNALVDLWQKEITSSSLQSFEELMRVTSYLGLSKGAIDTIKNSKNDIADAFVARNQVAHEMDVDFSQPQRGKRTRRQRKRDLMDNHAKLLLGICNLVIGDADSILQSK